MGADLITTTDMGYIFEELVRKFSESYNEEAGAHLTARDIIYTMTDLLEKKSINTIDAKSEVILTIMASLVQQESQLLSQNVKLGLQYRYQQGKVQVNHNRFLGYTKDQEGNLIIEPEGAKVVKRIFREYLEGEHLAGICKGLMRDGFYTAAGNPKWRPETVRKILPNEKYIGDALLQKTYTVDFLTKKAG